MLGPVDIVEEEESGWTQIQGRSAGGVVGQQEQKQQQQRGGSLSVLDHAAVSATQPALDRGGDARWAGLGAAGGGRLCSYCGTKGCVVRCSGCRQVWYCGEACQRRHWKMTTAIDNLQGGGGHREHCSSLAGAAAASPSAAVLPRTTTNTTTSHKEEEKQGQRRPPAAPLVSGETPSPGPSKGASPAALSVSPPDTRTRAAKPAPPLGANSSCTEGEGKPTATRNNGQVSPAALRPKEDEGRDVSRKDDMGPAAPVIRRSTAALEVVETDAEPERRPPGTVTMLSTNLAPLAVVEEEPGKKPEQQQQGVVLDGVVQEEQLLRGGGVGGAPSVASSVAMREEGPEITTTKDGKEEEQRRLISLLQDLKSAYADPKLQAALLRLQNEGEKAAYIPRLGALTEPVQRPIFQRYGYPSGTAGVALMKDRVRFFVVRRKVAEVARLARQCTMLLRLMPVGEGPVGEGWARGGERRKEQLHRVDERARAQSEEMARLKLKECKDKVGGGGSGVNQFLEQLLGEGSPNGDFPFVKAALATDDLGERERLVREGLTELYFKGVRNKALRQLMSDPEDLGADPDRFRGPWGEQVISSTKMVERLLQKGFLVLDDTLPGEEFRRPGGLLWEARRELMKLHQEGKEAGPLGGGGLLLSHDACNHGTRATFLNFMREEEQAHLRVNQPNLFHLSLLLAQLPAALKKRDATRRGEGSGSAAPSPSFLQGLRVPPTTMVSAYEPEIRYRRHLDSYGGADNHRMVTVLLYLNSGEAWGAPGQKSPGAPGVPGGCLRLWPPGIENLRFVRKPIRITRGKKHV